MIGGNIKQHLKPIKRWMIGYYTRYIARCCLLKDSIGSRLAPDNDYDMNTTIGDYVTVSGGSSIRESHFGDYTSVGRNATIWYARLGKFCSLSWNVTIGATQHHTDRLSTHAFPYISKFGLTKTDERTKIKTVIGHDVWIGANAVIMPGVTVGNGAVIGAGAVVTKDVEPYSIVAGVPAKEIRRRFDSQTIATIQSLQWWDWDRQTLCNNIDLFKRPLTEEDLVPYLSLSSGIKTGA